MTLASEETPKAGKRPDTLSDGLTGYRIGPKIRALRQDKGLSLSQLGDHSGLSAGMISKIERGQLFPTLPTLLRIAMVFGVRLEHFFLNEGAPVLEIVRRKDRLRLPNVVNGRPVFFFESLDFPVADKPVESYLAEFLPRRAATPTHSHKGVELIYVMDGSVGLSIHNLEHRLDFGDSIYFDAGFDHSYRCIGESTAKAMVVVAGGGRVAE